MNAKLLNVLKNAGGALLGALIVSPLFFLPYAYTAVYNLGLYVVSCIYFYSERRNDYYVNYGDLFKLSATLIALEALSIALHYHTYNLDWFSGLILVVIDSVAKSTLVFYGLYLWMFKKAKPKKTWAELTDAELLQQYVAQAKMWGEITNALGEQEKIDQRFHWVWGAYAEMKRRDKTEMLVRLLTSKYAAVKLFAARHLLWTNEQEALWALREVRAGDDEVAKIADVVIQEWEAEETPPDSKTLSQAA